MFTKVDNPWVQHCHLRMQLTESFLQDYALERCCVKPEIRLHNYALKWDESSCGIPQKEVPELKAFLKEILPYISGAFFKAAGQISKAIEEEVSDVKQVRKIHDSFSPQLHISYRKADHEYILQMQEDGATIIRRNETATTSSRENREKSGKRPTLYVNFLLGELVFIR